MIQMNDGLFAAVQRVRKFVDEFNETHAAEVAEAPYVSDLSFWRLREAFTHTILASTKVVLVPDLRAPKLAIDGEKYLDCFNGNPIAGITFPGVIYINSRRALDERLHFHELVHAVQYNELGTKDFIALYFWGVANSGYQGCPFEIIAYELEKQYPSEGYPKENPEVESRIRAHAQQIKKENSDFLKALDILSD